jgi:hypothetical protein
MKHDPVDFTNVNAIVDGLRAVPAGACLFFWLFAMSFHFVLAVHSTRGKPRLSRHFDLSR